MPRASPPTQFRRDRNLRLRIFRIIINIKYVLLSCVKTTQMTKINYTLALGILLTQQLQLIVNTQESLNYTFIRATEWRGKSADPSWILNLYKNSVIPHITQVQQQCLSLIKRARCVVLSLSFITIIITSRDMQYGTTQINDTVRNPKRPCPH